MAAPPNRLAGDTGFKGKVILMSGGSGFLGKVLTEKILRSCPLVGKIYIIVRAKKGKSPQERMKDIFSNPLFDLLKKTHGEEILEKVVAVDGDMMEVDMGMSRKDREMLAREVNIIYHMAATIRFDEPFKKAVLLNTRGTKMMLQFAQECKKLMVFVHMSTSYCHLDERILFETTYPPPANPHNIIKIVEDLKEEVVDAMAKKLMKNFPNSYAFTKALSEGLINEQMDKLPILILRPSVVIPIWCDPIPGWTDNINGPAGLLIAAGKGVLRTMYCDPKGYADFLPVDVAASATMVATYDFLNFRTSRIVHLTSSFEYKVTWSEIIELGRHIINTRMPLNWVVWYPGGSMKKSRFVHNICVVLFHYIPAVILDALIILTGNKPILWRVQQRITKGFEIFEFYANNQWDFNCDKALQIRERLNETERKIYKLFDDDLNLEDYFCSCIHAARIYILKEGDETLPTAKRHMKVMWVVDKICKFLILVGFGYLLMKWFVYPFLGEKSASLA